MGAGFIAGAVGRPVVDDDGLEATVPWHLVQDAADLAGLVERRDHDGDERPSACFRDHGSVWHPGAHGQPADGTAAHTPPVLGSGWGRPSAGWSDVGSRMGQASGARVAISSASVLKLTTGEPKIAVTIATAKAAPGRFRSNQIDIAPATSASFGNEAAIGAASRAPTPRLRGSGCCSLR